MIKYNMLVQRAQKLFSDLPADKRECNLGGCDNHSGHEYCSRSEVWEYCMFTAEDELFEQESDLEEEECS